MHIAIIGGYGKVGRQLTALFVRHTPYRILIAGRRAEKARRVAARWGNGQVTGTALDLTDRAGSWGAALRQIEVVIVCVDQQSTGFAEWCLREGKLYFDISAQAGFLQALLQLNADAQSYRGLAVTSLGLSPGLTNLLAKDLLEKYPQVEHVRIGILLGLGEKHGKAAIEWTLDNFSCTFRAGGLPVRSFSEPYGFAFPRPFGKRKAYRFNFSDQHTLRVTYPATHFFTYLCFDSALITRLFFLLKKIGLSKWLSSRAVKPLVVLLLQRLRLGSSAWGLVITGSRGQEGVVSYRLLGRESDALTAKFTFACIQHILRLLYKKDLRGVWEVQSVVSLTDVWPAIEANILSFDVCPHG